MSSLNFLDLNVWLALVWARHSHSDRAHAWFEQADSQQFLFCRFTQLGLLRLLTNKAVMGSDVKTTMGAWEIYDQCCADERIAFLPEPNGIDPMLRSYARSRQASPQVWADAYLAAFANAAGLRLVTFDKGFRTKPVHCLVLE